MKPTDDRLDEALTHLRALREEVRGLRQVVEAPSRPAPRPSLYSGVSGVSICASFASAVKRLYPL